MRSRIIALLAALALVAGCETAPTQSGGAAGTGSAAGGSDVTSGGSSSVTSGALGPEQQLVKIGDRVYFGFDEYALSPEARATLDRQAAFLTANPTINVTIEGHADERGTREYNLALGARRASSVKDYLVALGVAPNRMTTISYGEERPAVVGSNEAAWAKNRRAVTVVVSGRVGS